MIESLFRRWRVVDGREVQEPTLLALGLTATGFLLLLAVFAAAAYATANFGLGWWLFGVVGGLLAALVLTSRLRHRECAALVTGRRLWLRRLCATGRIMFVVVLSGWLGLIAWAELSPGGPMPPSKADPGDVRVLTWNILRGREHGFPWEQNNWPARKQALAEALRQTQPDILLVQEALLDQLTFLDEALPGHRRVGVGRDDGKSGGEHCAIYFNEARFQQIAGGTFWLEEPTDRPRRPGWNVKRICTWVRLRDPTSGCTLCLYNVHQYLTEGARLPAAQILLDRINLGDPSDVVLLAGDFNATPEAPSRRLFAEAGLRESTALIGKRARATYQFCGVRCRCLDGIRVGPGWHVQHSAVVDVKPRGLFPSDHFGVLADLTPGR